MNAATFDLWIGTPLGSPVVPEVKNIYANKLPIKQKKMFIYLHKKHTNIVNRLTKSMRSMKKDGSYQKIFDRTLARFVKDKAGIKAGEIKPSMLEEEINLLYVATTRTKSKLHIPIKLLPTGFYVEGMKSITTGTALKLKQDFSKRSLPNKNAKWTKGEEIELSQLFLSGKPIPHIARLLGRSQTAIKSRIDKLDLWEKYY